MSHLENTTILEQHFEDVSELTRFELIQELARHAGPTVIVFPTPLPLMSFDELAEMVANKRFVESPQIAC